MLTYCTRPVSLLSTNKAKNEAFHLRFTRNGALASILVTCYKRSNVNGMGGKGGRHSGPFCSEKIRLGLLAKLYICNINVDKNRVTTRIAPLAQCYSSQCLN